MNDVNGHYDDSKHPFSHPRPDRSPRRPPQQYLEDFPGPPVVLAGAYPPHPEVLPPAHLLPKLPSGQRKPIWHDDSTIPYTLTTHIIPAAYWREDSVVELPQPPNEGVVLTKADRQRLSDDAVKRLNRTREELEAEAARQVRGGKRRRGRQQVLWLCVNRYVRYPKAKGNSNGVTLFAAHANGFNKEIWEPTLAALLASPSSQALIEEVWVWDAANHGDSALLNDGLANSLFHWRNGARDLVTFFTHYLPAKWSADPLPTHLVRLPQSEVSQRLKFGFYDPSRGFKKRTIVGIGHSFGGCICTLTALSSPISGIPNINTNFFSLLVLIDPVIQYPRLPEQRPVNNLAAGAFVRRSTWESREAAREGFLKSPFFQRWDPRVIDLYVEGGICQSGNQVKLKMSPLAETIAFIDTWTGSEEAWLRLYRGELSAKDVGLRWVVVGSGQRELEITPASTRERVWLRPDNSDNVRVPGAGHLVPQEKPNELGEVLRQFIHGYFAVPKALL